MVADPIYVTAKQAAAAMIDERVTPGMVRVWASDGLLTAVRTVRQGRGRPRPLYDLTDVWRVYNTWSATRSHHP
jgi:hypothetical protein